MSIRRASSLIIWGIHHLLSICHRCRFYELIYYLIWPADENESGLLELSMPGPGLACDCLFAWLLNMLFAAAPWIGPGPCTLLIGLAFPFGFITFSFPYDESLWLWYCYYKPLSVRSWEPYYLIVAPWLIVKP